MFSRFLDMSLARTKCTKRMRFPAWHQVTYDVDNLPTQKFQPKVAIPANWIQVTDFQRVRTNPLPEFGVAELSGDPISGLRYPFAIEHNCSPFYANRRTQLTRVISWCIMNFREPRSGTRLIDVIFRHFHWRRYHCYGWYDLISRAYSFPLKILSNSAELFVKFRGLPRQNWRNSAAHRGKNEIPRS